MTMPGNGYLHDQADSCDTLNSWFNLLCLSGWPAKRVNPPAPHLRMVGPGEEVCYIVHLYSCGEAGLEKERERERNSSVKKEQLLH